MERIAAQVASAQLDQLHSARRQVEAALGARPETVVLSGEGEFLGQTLAEPLDARIVSVAGQHGQQISSAACAHALAILALEMDRPERQRNPL